MRPGWVRTGSIGDYQRVGTAESSPPSQGVVLISDQGGPIGEVPGKWS